ncbi:MULTISPECIES: SHOCT domain-containing protein [Nonomuraea]|uniref:SHOCT domain-containing protein n=1 Tax=Nonomuraea mangrovi TaxID=2316207 RepID=A0ABW4SSG6_9ACTN
MHSFWPIFPIFWILFWIAAVTLFVKARRSGRWGGWGGPPPSRTASAEQILAERYARGEMDDEEYLQRSSVLKS